MAIANPFVWGRGGAQLTPDQIAKQREIADALMKTGMDYSPVGSWTQGAARVADSLVGALQNRRLDSREAANQAYDADQAKGLSAALFGDPSAAAAPSDALPAPDAQAQVAATSPAPDGSVPAPKSGDVYSGFMAPVQAAIKNPYALAAVAATGDHESSFSPKLAGGSWADPSESGQAGQAGGVMSWRGPRLAALRNFAGGSNGTPEQQGQFFVQEDPQLIAKLNNAGSLEEAQGLMNNAWAFKGYNRFGGEAASRLRSAQSYLPRFQGDQAAAAPAQAYVDPQVSAPKQIASLDPSAGMASIPAAGTPLPGQPAPGEQIPVPTSRPSVSDAVTMAMAQNGVGADAQPDLSGGIPIPEGSPAVPSALLSRTPMANQTGGMQDATTGLLAVPAKTTSIPSDPTAAAAPPMSPPVDVPTVPVMPSPVSAPQVAAAQAAPAAALAPQGVQQVAQALMPQGTSPAVLQRAMMAVSDPRTSEGTRRVAGLLIQQEQTRRQAIAEQQLKQQDPEYQANLALTKSNLAKNEREANAPINANGVLVDPKTYKPVYQPGISATDQATLNLNTRKADDERSNNALTPDIKEYNFYADAARKDGHDPVAPDVFWAAQKKSGAGGTVINNGDNSGAFAKKADEEAATRMGGYISDGTAANRMLGDVQQLADLGSQIGTGKGAQVMAAIGPYAQAMGVDMKGLGEAQAYQAVIDRMAPNMRPTGAGSSSDTDVKMFLNSLPSLGNVPGGNQIITQTLAAIQQQKIAAAQIAQKAMMPKEAGGISWQQAEQQIRDLGNPYETFNKYRQTLSADGTKKLPSDSLTRVQSVDDYNGLAKGTQYVDPNGKVRTKN